MSHFATSHFATDRYCLRFWLLLALLGMERDSAKSRGVLLELQFFCSGFAIQHIIDVAGFLANQVGCFFLFLALGHGYSRLASNGSRKGVKDAYYANRLPGWLAQLGEKGPFKRVLEPNGRKNV